MNYLSLDHSLKQTETDINHIHISYSYCVYVFITNL